MHHFVFEIDLEMKRSLGVAEEPKKYFLMDEADGLHHSLRVVHARAWEEHEQQPKTLS
jgi:hypothetical protein